MNNIGIFLNKNYKFTDLKGKEKDETRTEHIQGSISKK